MRKLTSFLTPLGGEFCESGDWSLPMYCGDMSNIRVTFIEYGDGSGEAKLWNCLKVGSASTGGGSLPGTEAPSAAPGAGDPDPLCMDLTLAAGVTLNGTNTGTQFLNLDGQQVQYLVGEIQTCTANCDSTLIVSCGR
jgi:hypothetical protein